MHPSLVPRAFARATGAPFPPSLQRPATPSSFPQTGALLLCPGGGSSARAFPSAAAALTQAPAASSLRGTFRGEAPVPAFHPAPAVGGDGKRMANSLPPSWPRRARTPLKAPEGLACAVGFPRLCNAYCILIFWGGKGGEGKVLRERPAHSTSTARQTPNLLHRYLLASAQRN